MRRLIYVLVLLLRATTMWQVALSLGKELTDVVVKIKDVSDSTICMGTMGTTYLKMESTVA